MAHLIRRHLLLWVSVLVLTVSSALSAGMMAPERGDTSELQLSLMGMSLDDICGDEAGHEHRCPFCHLLSDPPMPAVAEVASRLMPFTAWGLARDLHRAVQARDHARSPRAPPVFV